MLSHRAKLFRGAPDVIEKSGGIHKWEFAESESLIINPKDVAGLSVVDGMRWYVENRAMKDLGYTIFTEWKPIYITNEIYKKYGSGTSFLARSSPEIYHIVPSIKSPIYMTHHNDVPLVPLLDTLIHVDQSLSGMTLCQIACAMAGQFKADFNDEHKVMRYLFEEYLSFFKTLCKAENVPLRRLYQCEFNITFNHRQQKISPIRHIRVIKKMDNVVMVPLSGILNSMTCGNIPWIISHQNKKNEIETDAKYILQPFGFFNKTARYLEIKGSITFRSVCILPEVIVRDSSSSRVYPPGALLGIVTYRDGSCDTVMRGELFEETTTHEQIILILMYDAFVDGRLHVGVDCSKFLRNLKLNEDQLPVREAFIHAIQAKLLETS